MKKVLFVGNFLSIHKGSIGPSEKLAKKISGDFVTKTVSNKKSQIFRLIDICFTALFQSPKFDYFVVDVYSTRAIIFAQAAAAIGKLRKVKVVLILHGGGLPNLLENKPQLIAGLFSKAWKIVSPSLYIKEVFEKAGYKIFTIPNSVDTEIFSLSIEERKPDSLLWVRAFKNIYNPEIPIKVLSILKEKRPNISLTMIGADDGLMENCKQLAKQLNVEDRINFLGSVENTQLPKYYRTSSVYLNTTSYESFGVALIEAAMCGIPIVTSKVGEIPYMWEDGEEVQMVDEINEEKFADKINSVLSDNSLAKKLAASAHKKANSYSWIAVKEKWYNLLGS